MTQHFAKVRMSQGAAVYDTVSATCVGLQGALSSSYLCQVRQVTPIVGIFTSQLEMLCLHECSAESCLANVDHAQAHLLASS